MRLRAAPCILAVLALALAGTMGFMYQQLRASIDRNYTASVKLEVKLDHVIRTLGNKEVVP